MAISIDNVYQQVLVIANKEQRGYITPQEFNLLARKAQLDVFENYFSDLDAFRKKPGNDTVYADEIDSIQEKIDVHEKFSQFVGINSTGAGVLPSSYKMGRLNYNSNSQEVLVTGSNLNSGSGTNTLTISVAASSLGLIVGSEVYSTATGSLIGVVSTPFESTIIVATTLTVSNGYITIIPSRSVGNYREVQLVSQNKLSNFMNSGKLNPTDKYPVYVKTSGTGIQVYPTSLVGVVCNYISKPTDPKWTYVVVNGKALYNASDSGAQDFQLHESEESTLTNKILELAGIVLNKPGLSEVILRNEQMKEAKENR